MESIVTAFAGSLGQYIPAELVVFIISMLPVLELRGGLIAAVLLGIPMWQAIPVCVLGNIIPIPFLLLFIERVLKWLGRFRIMKRFVSWIEERARKRTDKVAGFEFLGLTLFVGIPIPGTGAWTGSLVASILNMDFKKAVLAELLGVAIATVIMALISYGVIGNLIS